MALRSHSEPALAPTSPPAGAARRPGRPQTRAAADAGSRTLLTGIALLKVVAGIPEPANLTELARRAGMSPSRAYRYLVSLTQTGLVRLDRTSGAYALGPAALELGMTALSRVDAFAIGSEEMRELTAAVGIVSHISVWSANGPMSVRCEQGHLESGFRVREGVTVSLVTTAAGQIFLAYADETQIGAILRRDLDEWNAVAPARTQLSVAKLSALRKTIRSAGITAVIGMRNPHVSALSAPVFNRDGLAMSLTISGITGSFDASLDGEPARRVKESAARVSYRIGGAPPR
jgi:DNA-binding IclR family transcriptional regulator